MESTPSVQEQVKEKYGSAARAVAESGSVQATPAFVAAIQSQQIFTARMRKG
jgi:hypothetical protein